MYVNVAVLKETQPHERRVALVPAVTTKLVKLGAKLHMQSGAGDLGMPILNADQAKQVYVVKRGAGKGYADIVNALFYADNCNMVYGAAAAVMTMMIEAVRELGTKAAA